MQLSELLREEPVISITIDIEWAPDELIEYTLSHLDNFGIIATFFCTHKHGVKIRGHEIAIHPNFNKCDDYAYTLEKLIKIFPQAKGIRSHSLFTCSRLYPIYKRFGITYESNYFMYNCPNIFPFFMLNDILEIPIFFMDSSHIIRCKKDTFKLKSLKLETPGLKVFAFHPIHLFLNTREINAYISAKPFLHQPEKLAEFRNQKVGIENLFFDLLNYITSEELTVVTLIELDKKWRKEHKLSG